MPLLPTWLLYLLSPLGRYAALAALVLAAYGAWDLYIRHDQTVKVTAQIQHQEHVEKTNAIKKSDAARTRAVKRYDAGRMRDDGFARD